MRTRTIYKALCASECRMSDIVMVDGWGKPTPLAIALARQRETFHAELLRRMDERDALFAKAKAWDTFVNDFYRRGTAVDWKAFQDLRRSVGDFRMDADERPPYQYQPYTTAERIGQYMAGLSDDLKADDILGGKHEPN